MRDFKSNSLFFGTSNVELEENNISILNFVVFSLLEIFSLSLTLRLTTQSDKIFVFHDFCADEPLFEVGMNDSGGLWGLFSVLDCPRSDFIVTGSEEVDEV